MADQHLRRVQDHASRALAPALKPDASLAEIIRLYRSFLRKEELRIRIEHRGGAGGIRVARQRSELIDLVIRRLYEHLLKSAGFEKEPFTLIATGGYGRGLLNPGSDVDIMILVPGRAAAAVPAKVKDIIDRMIPLLWDVRVNPSHAVRSVAECVDQASKDMVTKCAFIDLRFICGDEPLFDKLQTEFRKHCLKGHEAAYLDHRRRDARSRHAKFSNTVYLQEPNVKQSCGALRDYQNILWVAYVKTGAKSMLDLHKAKMLNQMEYRETEKAFDFLHRVRNELHYLEKRPNDVLTLRLQGRVATNLKYPQKRIIERCEAFMKDYYHHTRNIYQHAGSLMQRFELAQEEEKPAGLRSFLSLRGREKNEKPQGETFDGFISRGGLIYPENDRIFKEDSGRMMRLFQHMQQRGLKFSPQLRQLVKENYAIISKPFRYRKTNRETFEAILSRKGEVGPVLRAMHRVGFLGRWLPEFGALTDLVQHEFFHRFTADEHTLRVAEQMDALTDIVPETQGQKIIEHLFHQIEDPYVIYLAILLHDAGRSTDAEHHEYASAIMADKVSRRFSLSMERRKLLMFLVDHHLTLWRTATSQNLEDPSVIADFCLKVRNRPSLDALLVFTYADSRGTNEASWTGFKESLLLQLYRSACAWFEDQQAFESRLHQPLEELKAEVRAKVDPSYEDEMNAHFAGMPERYFLFRGADSVVRHLKTFRAFYRSLRGDTPETALTPLLKWRALPEQGYSALTVISWDRHMLLARIAGVLAANNLNILGADFFTRQDNLVLDIFRVCTTDFQPVTNERILDAVQKKVEAVFASDETDFTTLVPRSTEPPDPEWEEMKAEFPTRVVVSNDFNPLHTVVEIEATDRLGLLCDIFRTIGQLGLEITHARIATEKGAAIDTLYISDTSGGKIQDRELLARLREELGRVARA